MAGKTCPAFLAYGQPAILRIWQEAHCGAYFWFIYLFHYSPACVANFTVSSQRRVRNGIAYRSMTTLESCLAECWITERCEAIDYCADRGTPCKLHMVPQQELTYSEGVDNYRLVRCSSTPGQSLMYILCVWEQGNHIDSGNGLLPARQQAIIRKKNWLIASGNFKNTLQWNSNQNTVIFSQENVVGNVVCKMATILFWWC